MKSTSLQSEPNLLKLDLGEGKLCSDGKDPASDNPVVRESKISSAGALAVVPALVPALALVYPD